MKLELESPETGPQVTKTAHSTNGPVVAQRPGEHNPHKNQATSSNQNQGRSPLWKKEKVAL